MGGDRDAIRGDQFYTSLLLGCRRVSGAPSAPFSASSGALGPPEASAKSPSARASSAAFAAASSPAAALSPASASPSDPPTPPAARQASGKKRQLPSDDRERGNAGKAALSMTPGGPRSLLRQQSEESEDVANEDAYLTPVAAERDVADMAAAAQGRNAGMSHSPKSGGRDDGEQDRKPKRRFRKATHTVRKEEKEHLLKEIDQLETHISELKARALGPARLSEQSEQDKVLATRVLRDAVQQQQREFAKIQAIMSEYTLCNIRAGSPLQSLIRLTKHEPERRHRLMEHKVKKLHAAKQFLARRRPNIDPCKPMCEDHRYELPNGDFCSTRFTTIQFEGVTNVRQVFDLLVEYFCNIEISISEKLGHITIREDDDSGGVGITQNCLVSTTNSGLPLESNTVLFSEFYEPDNDPGHSRGHGLIVADFIDEDERHQYRPRERIRRDVSAILELTSFTRKVEAFGKNFPVNPNSQPQEGVVVLTRWVYSKLRYPTFPIARAAWEDLRDNMDRWGETMHRTIVESLRTNSTMTMPL